MRHARDDGEAFGCVEVHAIDLAVDGDGVGLFGSGEAAARRVVLVAEAAEPRHRDGADVVDGALVLSQTVAVVWATHMHGSP